MSNDKWIEHKFEHQNSIAQIASREIAIHLQKMISYLKFLMAHPSLWQNQKYELFCIYNDNKQQVYNEMHTGEWQSK